MRLIYVIYGHKFTSITLDGHLYAIAHTFKQSLKLILAQSLGLVSCYEHTTDYMLINKCFMHRVGRHARDKTLTARINNN